MPEWHHVQALPSENGSREHLISAIMLKNLHQPTVELIFDEEDHGFHWESHGECDSYKCEAGLAD